MLSLAWQTESTKCKTFTGEEYVEEGGGCSVEGSSALWSNRQLLVSNAGALSI